MIKKAIEIKKIINDNLISPRVLQNITMPSLASAFVLLQNIVFSCINITIWWSYPLLLLHKKRQKIVPKGSSYPKGKYILSEVKKDV
jgi:hypothetical protein